MAEGGNNIEKIKLEDIAQESGVSISTVSRVLNNSSKVSTAAKEKVREAMLSLGYISKEREYKKKNQNNGYIAFMVPELANPFGYELTYKVEKLISKAGYVMALSVFDNDMETIDKYCKELLLRKVNGCICVCMLPVDKQSWFYKMAKKVPTVCFQSDVENLDQVNTTDWEGTFEMVDYLIRHGHRRIGFIGYNWGHSLFERRLSAYKKAHEKNGVSVSDELVGLSEANLKSGYDEACRLLSLPERPTAIHCLNTYTAMGVNMAIRDNKLRIPEDISLSGFDEVPVTQALTPPLSVVEQPLNSIANTLVRMLLERIENGIDAPMQTVTFPTKLYIRESVGPCPKYIVNGLLDKGLLKTDPILQST